MHRMEGARDHARTDVVRRRAGIVDEQAGAPAAGQDRPGEQPAREIEDLPHVVIEAQPFGRMMDHGKGVTARDAGGTADPQMKTAVLVERNDDRALAEQGLDHELFVRITLPVALDQVTGARVLDIVEAPDVEGGVGPVGDGEGLDDAAHAAAPFDEHDITGLDLEAQAFEVGWLGCLIGRFSFQPGGEIRPEPALNPLKHLHPPLSGRGAYRVCLLTSLDKLSACGFEGGS